jgi:pilus assembly protein Flp/PilA
MIHTLHFMKTMILGLDAKRRSEEGATAVEYGLLVALIAAVIVGVVVTLGAKVKGGFTTVDGKLPAAPAAE